MYRPGAQVCSGYGDVFTFHVLFRWVQDDVSVCFDVCGVFVVFWVFLSGCFVREWSECVGCV